MRPQYCNIRKQNSRKYKTKLRQWILTRKLRLPTKNGVGWDKLEKGTLRTPVEEKTGCSTGRLAGKRGPGDIGGRKWAMVKGLVLEHCMPET